MDAEAGSRRGRELHRLLEIFGLGGFAFTQPVLDVMGRSPQTFIFRGAGIVDVVLLALALAVLPAVALWGLGVLLGALGLSARRAVHVGTVGALVAVIALQVLHRVTPWPSLVVLAAALLLGAAAGWLYLRAAVVRTWARWAAIVPVLSVGAFLVLSAAAKLLRTPGHGSAAPDAAPVPVVMVMFDEFPLASLLDGSGNIDADLYPGFAELADRSTWYRNYTVTESGTQFSVPTILTGRTIRDRSAQPLAADHPNNLFTLLSETHRMEVLEPYTALCPERLCGAPGSGDGRGGLAALLGDAALVWREVSVPGTTTRDVAEQFDDPDDDRGALPDPTAVGLGDPGPFGGFLRSLANGEPALHYVHVMLPHVPWKRFPDGREYDVTGAGANFAFAEREGRQLWVDDPWPVQLARQRHLLQVQYVDRLIGELLDRLETTGLLDEALVVVTSDHGGSTTPGQPRRAPTPRNAHEIYWVPLFVKAPGQTEGATDDRNLMSTDLLPTLADLLDTEVPWPVDGTSAQDRDADRGPTKTFTIRPRDASEGEQTLTIAVADAERRVRADAFRPAGPCPPELCPHVVGPAASLIGRPIDELSMGPPSERSATLSLPRDLTVMDGSPLPALVLGTIDGMAEGDLTRVAVAMNGAIAGASDTWIRGDTRGIFGVLVPQALLLPGANELLLFELDGATLRPIAFSR